MHVRAGGVITHLGEDSCAEVDASVATVICYADKKVCDLLLFIGERANTSGGDRARSCTTSTVCSVLNG